MTRESHHWMGIGIVKSLKGGFRVLIQSTCINNLEFGLIMSRVKEPSK
jgi:hypothetical protein